MLPDALGSRRAMRVGWFPRIARAGWHPFNLAVFTHDTATAWETIDGVVVLAQRSEVLGVRFAAVSPFCDVVYLGIIGAAQAAIPSAGGLLAAGHDALLLRGDALGAVEFHGAFDAVNNHDEAFFGELALDELLTSNLGAVG